MDEPATLKSRELKRQTRAIRQSAEAIEESTEQLTDSGSVPVLFAGFCLTCSGVA